MGFVFAFKGGVAIEAQFPLRAGQQRRQVGLVGVVAGQAVAIGNRVVQLTATGELTMAHGTNAIADIGSKGGKTVESGVVLGMAHGAAVAVGNNTVNHLFFAEFSVAVKAFHAVQGKIRSGAGCQQQYCRNNQTDHGQKTLMRAIILGHGVQLPLIGSANKKKAGARLDAAAVARHSNTS